MKLVFIGGASGVGKTSLLKAFLDIKQINTGDEFKRFMMLPGRDEIRNGDWSVFESEVTESLIDLISCAVKKGEDLIIDTHFAAKIFAKRYRIGLKEKYLYQIGQSIFSLDLENVSEILTILVATDPLLLLARRRLDRSRNRELIPSDCFNDLRNNDIYSSRYMASIRRAAWDRFNNQPKVKIQYEIVKNNVFEQAQNMIDKLLRR
ncbi:MAG: hypothetical protein Q8P25_00200 [Candidatus Curtissbacteria bacterium]|nr:hypothetical protein [Candidatus Curtissbacteria bacterium]